MHAIMETLFNVFYLISVILLGYLMIKNNKDKYTKLFGYMAVILGLGDSFHLIPRVYALLTDGLESHVAILGFGKLVTSITMTIFYLILYNLWKIRFDKHKEETSKLNISIYLLAATRIILCLFPQNNWFNYNPPVSWGIYRNIPFVIMGIIIVYLLYKDGKKNKDKVYINLSIAVTLSFAFYIPVVLFGTTIRIIGVLMIPKTLAYLWIAFIGYKDSKN